MTDYLQAFIEAITGTVNWVWNLITFREVWYKNYFYGLILISLAVWALEILFPWRKNQRVFRKDFWLDAFYMFFNFFIFAVAISGFYKVAEVAAADLGFRLESLGILNLDKLPRWLGLIIFFVLSDFVQWFTHVLLHRYPFLWRFHQVHHSVEEMGFAAHLRFHWMENIFYKPLKMLVVLLIGGVEPEMAYVVHFIAILIGHLNHANVRITWGPLKYIFNNSVMHLYHHARALPGERVNGVNFGISLSLWDYIFGTNYIPQDQDGDYQLGFDGREKFPDSFWKQLVYGFKKTD